MLRPAFAALVLLVAGCGGEPAGERAAREALGDREGAVVAIDLESGERLLAVGDADALVPPGSTLKALFAGGALADGLIDERTRLGGGETVGDALVASSNDAFVDLTRRMGAARIERWLRAVRWGTPDVPSLELPGGGYRDPDLHQRGSVAQMAGLAAEIAGERIWPADVAAFLRREMRRVVTEGTGTSMRDSEVAIAAKTGTMTRDDGMLQASVIALAPADDPRIAIAASVVAPRSETGGTAAGPVVREVLEALLR